jgi:replication factor A1
MKVADIKPNQGNIEVVAEVIKKDSPRSFEKFGKSGRVCNYKIKDDSGEISLTLWNDDIDKVNEGDTIHLQNGWCTEYKTERQVSTGKFGKVEVTKAASPSSKKVESAKQDSYNKPTSSPAKKAAVSSKDNKTIFSNDPEQFGDMDKEDDESEEPIDDEEFVD